MSLWNRLVCLEKISIVAFEDAFFRHWDEYRNDPKVSAAADELSRVLNESEADAGHETTPRAGFDDDGWLERPGVAEALDRLFLAVEECEGTVAKKGGRS